MSGLRAWAEEHVGCAIEIGGAQWCLESVRDDGRALLREEAAPGIRSEAARVRVAPLTSVYHQYIRQNAATCGDR